MPTTTTHPVTSAIHCASYQCGHIARSDDRAIKRALFLYLRREAGHTFTTRGEGSDVIAALALMREGRPCSEVRNYRTPGVRAADVPTTPANVAEVRVSPQVVEVVTLIAQGYDIPEIAAMTHRAIETVRSLLAVARRATGAHTSHGAAVALVGLGLISA